MLNFSKCGKPICIISGGRYDKKVISLDVEADDETYFNKLKISNDSKFCPVPNTTTERDILYITGCSGSGKSTFTRLYLEQYKKKYKNREIYMFSSLKEDKSLDSIKPKRFIIDESLYTDPIKVEDLKESAIIFDDIDVVADKKIKEAIYNILNQVLEIGRHYNITCIVTNHLPTNGIWTRRILNESSAYVYFPASAGGKVKYLLTEYLDIDKKQIRYWKKCNTRWVLIGKNFPMYYICEHECGLINIDTDSEHEPKENKK
jgi:energy-coupling factor transporter ATP-binding protein EcfA2